MAIVQTSNWVPQTIWLELAQIRDRSLVVIES